MIKKLYLDLDGVLVDFDLQFERIIGVRPENSNRNDHVKNFTKFVRDGGFLNAPQCENAKMLFDTLYELSNKYDFDMLFLTSDGSNRELRQEVMEQKIEWLQNHGFWLGESKFILSNGWHGKADYAKGASTLLVDDTKRNIDAWVDHGGIGYQYDPKHASVFLNEFEGMLKNAKNR